MKQAPVAGADTPAPAKEAVQEEEEEETKRAEEPSPAKSLFKLFAPAQPGDDDEKRRLRAEV